MASSDAEILEILAPWLPQRRWFAGKGRRITDLHMGARHPIPGVEGAEHLIVNVHFENVPPQSYQVPVLITDEEETAGLIGLTTAGCVHDGMLQPAVVEAMLAWSQDQIAVPHGRGVDTGPHCQWVVPPQVDGGYRVLTVEQSNSSGVLGVTTFVKAFRLLTPGVNPDIEVHSRLNQVGCADVGSLRGWLWGTWSDPATDQTVGGHLAMMLEYFPDSVDGWHLARQRVRAGADFSSEAHYLGRTTARVHRDLRRAFPTRTLGPDGIAALSQRLQERLSIATRAVPQIASIRDPLAMLLRQSAGIEPVELQRVHGDLHLGQVLRTAGGWRIIDFESEPGGAEEERTALDHTMRDVAGMLRSFAYAAAGGAPPEWEQRSTAAFLTGYADEGGLVDESLLLAYLVDKAAYEAVYETRNRPDWVQIPLAALRELAATGERQPRLST